MAFLTELDLHEIFIIPYMLVILRYVVAFIIFNRFFNKMKF